MASVKDYLILRAIGSNKAEDKGRVKAYGTTVKEIQDRTKDTPISRSKISQALNDFIKQGFVEQGLSVGNAKTYIITDKGIESLIEVYGIEEEIE